MTGVSGAFTSSYTYDNAGNRLSAGSDTFQYDWRGSLRSATVGGTSVSYGFDGEVERTSRTQGSTTTPYLWDRAAGLPALVDDGTSVHLSLGGAGEAISLADGSSTPTYPLTDALGSTRDVTDATGASTASADYNAWGNLRASSGPPNALFWSDIRRLTASR